MPVFKERVQLGKYYGVAIRNGEDPAQPPLIACAIRPGGVAPTEYNSLYIEIERTYTVIKVLFFSGRRGLNEGKFAEYFLKLANIALAALGQDQPQIGRMALVAFQDDFVSREAASVKNAYIVRLGGYALLFGSIAAIFYLFCRYETSNLVLHRNREFVSLVIGSLLGTWLSFSIRRVKLTFWDLARLEEDLLDPSVRLIFVAGLTIVVGLLLATKAIVITIGEFNSDFLVSGTKALLIGCLCGIGEMGLPSAVARRATEFIAPISATRGTEAGSAPEAALATSVGAAASSTPGDGAPDSRAAPVAAEGPIEKPAEGAPAIEEDARHENCGAPPRRKN